MFGRSNKMKEWNEKIKRKEKNTKTHCFLCTARDEEIVGTTIIIVQIGSVVGC
jgi:hypothetical protein